MDELPFEEINPESDLNFEGVLYREASEGWSPAEDIDWEQEIELPDEIKKAIAGAATQFYYSNISHLMLSGRLMEKGKDMELKKLALYLAFSKMRNIDAFGRYLARVEEREEVAPYTKEYFSRMSTDADVPNLLLGMAVLGGTVGYGTLESVIDATDPIMEQIASNVIEQKKKNEDLLVNYLGNVVDAATDEELEELVESARFYRDQSEKIVIFHGNLFETLGTAPEEVVDRVLDATDQFYEKIGLEI